MSPLTNPVPGPWIPVFGPLVGDFPPAIVGGTYTFDTAGVARLSAAALSPPVIPLVPIVAADWSVPGALKVRMVLQTNGTAPAITFTAGLSAVSAVGGAAGVNSTTFGAAVAGSTAANASPAANASFTTDSADFALPADGRYVLSVLTSGALAATNPRVKVALSLLRRV